MLVPRADCDGQRQAGYDRTRDCWVANQWHGPHVGLCRPEECAPRSRRVRSSRRATDPLTVFDSGHYLVGGAPTLHPDEARLLRLLTSPMSCRRKPSPNSLNVELTP